MDCANCDWLWRTYAFATKQHVDLIRPQEQAAVSEDIEKMKSLEERVGSALERRELARTTPPTAREKPQHKIRADIFP